MENLSVSSTNTNRQSGHIGRASSLSTLSMCFAGQGTCTGLSAGNVSFMGGRGGFLPMETNKFYNPSDQLSNSRKVYL